ncbi:MAG: tetratricopeptide repeat protein [Crocinitomicaceae bacterium]|nr:tetratricopeptide repeat protein [Crocinitomicaceae bacterium]
MCNRSKGINKDEASVRHITQKGNCVHKISFLTLVFVCLTWLNLSYCQKDTTWIKAQFEKCEYYRYSQPDSSKLFAYKALKASQKIDYTFGIAKSYYYLGDAYLTLVDFSLALDYLDSTIRYAETHEQPEIEVDAINLKGIMYSDLGEYDRSIELYKKGLAKSEELEYQRGQIIAKSNTGVSYYLKGEFDRSLEYFISSLDNFMAIGDTINYLICSGNIASVYTEIDLYEESLEILNEGLEMCKQGDRYMIQYTELLSQKALTLSKMGDPAMAVDIYLQCIEIKKGIPDWRGASRLYNNIAEEYFKLNRANDAIAYAERAMEIADSLGYKRDLAFYNKTLAECFHRVGDDARAKKYILKSVKMSKELDASSDLKDAYALSSKIFAGLGDYQKAYEYQTKMNALKDSLEKIASEQTLEELAVLHQLDKRELENEKLKEENEKEKLNNLLKDEQLARDRAQKIYLTIGLLVMLVFGIFVFRAYQNKKKTNALISSQKEKIELQHEQLDETLTEIKDSITYAQRIQNAILPSPHFWGQNLDDSFVLYLPKDIVAGDFYWMEKTDDAVYFAAADCTGHGVPGAMVSVVCNNALNRAVREFKLTKPGEILDKVTSLVIETFEKSGEEVKDGMDIALCKLQGMKLEFAGAHNPLWLVRSGEMDQIEANLEEGGIRLFEYKANKQPVGQYSHTEPFITKSVQLMKGDTIYLSSDGFPDQFGGDKGKKLKNKNFKKLILGLSQKPIEQQKVELNDAFTKWKGNFEQLDDVCVIGVRV